MQDQSEGEPAGRGGFLKLDEDKNSRHESGSAVDSVEILHITTSVGLHRAPSVRRAVPCSNFSSSDFPLLQMAKGVSGALSAFF